MAGICAPEQYTTEEKGHFRRMGMIDAVLFRWEVVDMAEVDASLRNSFVEKAWGPRQVGLAVAGHNVYTLVAEKLKASSFVWLCAEKRPKKQATPAPSTLVAEEKAVAGNINSVKF